MAYLTSAFFICFLLTVTKGNPVSNSTTNVSSESPEDAITKPADLITPEIFTTFAPVESGETTAESIPIEQPENDQVLRKAAIPIPSTEEPPNVAAASNPVAATDFQCYKCDYFKGGKCDKQATMVAEECSSKICYHIVGILIENGKEEKNVVFAGCDYAPALSELAGLKQSITHTSHKNMGCMPFNFVHADQGAGSSATNYSISYKGESCNCKNSGCNKDLAKLFVPNSGAPSTGAKFLTTFALLITAVCFFAHREV